MGMLLHRHLAEKKPDPPAKKPVQEETKEAVPAKKPGRPKKNQ